jgi:deoxyadenosine/deoxycytidine kinase
MQSVHLFSIAGVHGVGKTTIYNALKRMHSSDYRWVFMPERTSGCPYPFGSKDNKVAFRAELWYLCQMLKRNNLIKSATKKDAIVICDQSPLCVLAYANILCSPRDFQSIVKLYSVVNWEDEVMFHLEAGLDDIVERINSRNRSTSAAWNEGDKAYITNVAKVYQELLGYIDDHQISEVVRITNGDAGPAKATRIIDAEILQRITPQ